jgi:GWxTD domain-containing protein
LRRSIPRSALLLLCLASVPTGAPSIAATLPGAEPGEPAVSSGELRYHATAVAFRHGPSQARAEFFIRIPYREIRFVHTGDRYEGRLRITVDLRDRRGKRAGYEQREARLQSTDSTATADSLLGEVYSIGITAGQGQYRYRVTVEDMNAARMGLLSQVRNQQRQGEVQGAIDLGAWLFRNPGLSGIEFAWQIQGASLESAFVKGPYEVQPHPSAYYGLFNDAVSAYYEIYDAPPPPEGRVYRIRSTILADRGDTLLTTLDSLRVSEGTAWPHAWSADVASFPAGHYHLRLELLGDREVPVASTESEFDVLWSLDSWDAEASDLYEVSASTLMAGEAAEQFRLLPRGRKEATLDSLWRSIDPTPETGENELRLLFRQRIAYANAHYSIFMPGMFTDRGRVWIRYGEPDEIHVERIPVSDKTLGFALDRELPKGTKTSITKTDQGVADFRPYEIWTYNLKGHEIVPGQGMNEMNSGLKFIFVDDLGYGEYTLRYSTTSVGH